MKNIFNKSNKNNNNNISETEDIIKSKNININKGLDLLITARKVFYLQIIGFFIIVGGIFYFINFQKETIYSLTERLKKRDVLILSSSGYLTLKTITSKNEILKQFGIFTFLSTLNYDNYERNNIFNFMRIYSSQEVFKSFMNNVINDAKIQRKIYNTYIDYTFPITIKEIKKNELYKITLHGIQYVYDGNTYKSYKIQLTLFVKYTNATIPENIFNIKIISYNLKVL